MHIMTSSSGLASSTPRSFVFTVQMFGTSICPITCPGTTATFFATPTPAETEIRTSAASAQRAVVMEFMARSPRKMGFRVADSHVDFEIFDLSWTFVHVARGSPFRPLT
jgi:hypothetical protein